MTARAVKTGLFALMLAAAAFSIACQSPSKSTDTYNVDDFVDSMVTPDPASGVACTDGKTYRIVRGNNQPDDILLYDWVTTFTVTLTFNATSTEDNVDIQFPVDVTSASVKIEQATGGIITPPTGGDVEHYDSVMVSSTGKSFTKVGQAQGFTFQVWYDLPSLRAEALATVAINLQDDDDVSFSKVVKVLVK